MTRTFFTPGWRALLLLALVSAAAVACRGGADGRPADASGAAPPEPGAGAGAAADAVPGATSTAPAPEPPPPTRPTPPPPVDVVASASPTGEVATAAALERRNQELSAALGLPLYPGARNVPSLSSEAAGALRIVQTTDDPCDRVVRFYEQATGLVAQVTELSDGDIYDLVLKSSPEGEPVHGVQVRQTPRAVSDRLTGRTSVILFRKAR
jgi:hypothetical protein